MAVTSKGNRRRAGTVPKTLDVARDETATGGPQALTEQDIYLLREGTHARLYDKMGCHLLGSGARFSVWAPDARAVSVIGDFNHWRADAHPAQPRSDGSGVWQVEIPAVTQGQRYKYAIQSRSGERLEKADPFARFAESAPATASIAWRADDHVWNDASWMKQRVARNALDAPMSIYELHLGSWRRHADGSMLNYREAATQLAAYVTGLGFTHVELMPITEHPFYGSWGYQTTGYFASTSRYGTPQDFKFLVDTLHQVGVAVILDWVPSHFPDDAHGLARFDGSHLYEHADPRQGFHPEWNSLIFNYGRNEVRAFLLSSGMFWLDEFHIDALRVDAVASMLYLDYSRQDGEWIPNRDGGRENLEAIEFLRLLNRSAYRDHPGVQIIAEESTAWPMVSRPTDMGGLGFGLKWNMGWMHDTLHYMQEDPVNRCWHHNELTFSLIYAFNENFLLPLSHDEVVYGKGSLLGKMPGDEWQKFANLRLLYGYMWAHPGKKLLFMGGEFGQGREWSHERALDWDALGHDKHRGLQRWVEDLNRLYRSRPALYELDFDAAGFEWIDGGDAELSVLAFLRKARDGSAVLVVANFTPVPRDNHLIGVPQAGRWRELLNSDAGLYGGSGIGNLSRVDTVPVAAHGRYQSLNLRLPPLAVLILEHDGQGVMTAALLTPIALHDGRIRVVIENIRPSVDGGRFPVKRVVGESLVVEADCFADGHDVIVCELLWRRAGADAWTRQRMQALGNDRWRAVRVVESLGDWQYTVQAWVDPFLSWRHDFERRIDLDDVRVAAKGGAALIEQAAARAGSGAEAGLLMAWAAELKAALAAEASLEALKALGLDELRGQMAQRHPDQQHRLVHHPVHPVTVERERARFSSWYEFFPRSAAGDGVRHGSFTDCEAWLPYVQRMGFDVLYFPPIHPVGRDRRKGRNNSLQTVVDDVGSPWAVGAAEGGHDAILSELGTLDDFKRLIGRAHDHGMEIALDIAFQCAPDHPWVKDHPQWFKARADGSIQYAENPPKKYQDIYPLDFESPQWQDLWLALAGVFEYWAGQGVRIFRVDNPHTKAFGFWEWAIARVRAQFPDVIFLSEAFTRPRVMHRLAKVGFSQSYTYFSWRNTKQELTAYFTELSQGPGREYFRPNAWPNTPDILPAALQYGGRPMFMARVALAATLAANYGIYGPAFELQEHLPLREGGEEYLDSEKFQLRAWDRERPDSLADFIGRLNQVRRDNPALQSDAGLRFLDIDNEQMIAYAKTSPDLSNIVVCVVNLDPHHAQSGWLEFDPEALGMQPQQAYQMHDAISGAHYLWQGPRNFVSLDPQRCPVHLMQLRRRMRRESDFDYFL